MKNENVIAKDAETKARWQKFKAMTDADIEAAIADDPDSQVPNSPEFLARGSWVEGGKPQIILPLS